MSETSDNKKLKIRIRGFGLSDIGGRKSNQDSFFCNDKLHFYLVADGMGGHSGGDIASLFTSKNMSSILHKLLEHNRPSATVADEMSVYEDTLEDDFFPVMVNSELILRHILWFTNEELHKLCKDRDEKMGTTLVAVWCRDDQIIFMNVGDSRAYIIWEGNLQRITHDHSKVEDVIREGDLSPDEARRAHKRNIITRSVGIHSEVSADFYTRPLHPGMRILLCSDGLYGALTSEQILECSQLPNLELACHELINAAKCAGEELVKRGKKKSYDNITAVLIDVGGFTVQQNDADFSSIGEDSIS